MKSVSLRAFNVKVKSLTEPVEVVTLVKETRAIESLGVYYPKAFTARSCAICGGLPETHTRRIDADQVSHEYE